MDNKLLSLIHKLAAERSLSLAEYEYLIENRCEQAAALLAQRAVEVRQAIYGNAVYIRGLIEISNI